MMRVNTMWMAQNSQEKELRTGRYIYIYVIRIYIYIRIMYIYITKHVDNACYDSNQDKKVER